jgi:hypothetical protein
MNKQDLLNKLAQIEEQARCTLAEFPLTLTKERLRMIIALARYLSTEASRSREAGLYTDTGAQLSQNDDSDTAVRSA